MYLVVDAILLSHQLVQLLYQQVETYKYYANQA